MAPRRTNPDYLNGIPELLILRLLSRQPMHGYEIVQSLAILTNGQLEFGEGCIYPLLHRLEMDGALLSRRQQVRGRSRVVYRVSAKGRRRLGTAVQRWNHVVEAVRRVLEGDTHGCTEVA